MRRNIQTGDIEVRLIPISDVTDEMGDRWRALVAQSLEPNPTFEPEALLTASRHDPAWTDARLLAVSEGDRLVVCLVVHPVERWHRLPVRVLTTRPDDGPVPLLPVHGTPLIAVDAGIPAVHALLSALAGGRVVEQVGDDPVRQPALLVLERWNDQGPVAQLWRETCRTLGVRFQVMDAWQRPLVRRAPDQAATWPASLDHKRRSRFDRRRRQLAEQVGEIRFADRWDESAAVDDFLALEASGWKGRAGTAMRTAPHRAAAFREICARWAAADRLSMFTLEVAGRPIAMQCAVRSGRGVFLYRTAYDESYARYGPGVLVELAFGEHWLEQPGVEWIDPCCAPSNTLYPDLFPDRLPVATAVTSLRAVGRAALAAQRVALPAAKRIRRSARRVNATRRATVGSQLEGT